MLQIDVLKKENTALKEKMIYYEAPAYATTPIDCNNVVREAFTNSISTSVWSTLSDLLKQ